MTAKELAQLIRATDPSRPDVFGGSLEFENYSRQLCEKAGLTEEFEAAEKAGKNWESIMEEAAKKLDVYPIIYGEEPEQ